MSAPISLAIIGGTGVYDLEGLSDVEPVDVATPYGHPSDLITVGALKGTRMAFLPRHGKGHSLLPHEVPTRANIWALKSLGVRQVVSISAVGSLRGQIVPEHFVVPDQLIDRTEGRPSSFFGEGMVAHVALADPFCPMLSLTLASLAEEAGATVHRGGCCVVINGPRFSTRAESNLYRSWGADLIGMTAMPEAQLAREAELCYAALMAVTDYDSWHDEEEPVTAGLILTHLAKNATTSKAVIRALASTSTEPNGCRCGDALADALVTPIGLITEKRRQELAPIIARYVK